MNDELLQQLLARLDRLENEVVSMRSLIVKQANQTLALRCLALAEISLMRPDVAEVLADRYEAMLDRHLADIRPPFQMPEILEEIPKMLRLRAQSDGGGRI